MLNHIDLIGRLTKDPEKRTTVKNVPVAKFTLAVERDFGPSEPGQKEADFFDIIIYGKGADYAEKYLSKGRMAAASGRLQLRPWEDKEGKRRYAVEVVADNVYGIGPNQNGNADVQSKRSGRSSYEGRDEEGDSSGLPF